MVPTNVKTAHQASPYPISSATSIDSACCRLPTHDPSTPSNKADNKPRHVMLISGRRSLPFAQAEFTPNEGARPVRLTVRQDVSAKMGMKKIGRTVYAFEFESSGAITATNSPTTVVGSFAPSENDAALPTTAVAAAAEALLASREGAERSSNGETWDRVVFVHDRVRDRAQHFTTVSYEL